LRRWRESDRRREHNCAYETQSHKKFPHRAPLKFSMTIRHSPSSSKATGAYL
jgi:hypothetical protein